MKITIDPQGLAEVCNGAQAVDALRAAAAATVDGAKQSGPRNPAHSDHIVDLIEVGEARQTDKGAAVEILWPTGLWHIIEFGSANNPPYRPITRSAQQAGLRVVDERA